jgi:low affinity Fe/Cu permease
VIRFARFTDGFSRAVGSPWAIAIAAAGSAGWLIAGPYFEWSDTWERIGSIFMTAATFLIVFLLQNTANRNSLAQQAKTDELIACTPGARNELIRKEESDEGEIEQTRL